MTKNKSLPPPEPKDKTKIDNLFQSDSTTSDVSEAPKGDESKALRPVVRRKGSQLLSLRSFSIVRDQNATYSYLVILNLNHEGEINPMNLATDNSEIISFEFSKHTEEYRGSFINYGIVWDEGNKPVLKLFFTCVKIK